MHAIIVILNAGFLVLLSAWCWKREEAAWRKIYIPALAVRTLAGIALGIIYSTYYETSDTFAFFNLAAEKAMLARTDFTGYVNFLFSPNQGYFLGEHRTLLFVKIISVLAWLGDNNYWVVALYCSMISFFAAWHLTKTIARFFPTLRTAACLAFLFFPGVVFWSSGLLKESLAMAGLFYLTTLFVRLWMGERVSLWAIIPATVAVWLVYNLKYYYLAAYLPVTLSVLVVRWISIRWALKRFVVQLALWVVVLICGVVLVTFIHPNFSPDRLLTVIVSNNRLFMEISAPDDVIHFYNLQPAWYSVAINTPWAFFSTLFRPFLWEANTFFKAVTAVQNAVLLLCTIVSLPLIIRIKHSPHRLLILSIVLYVIIVSVFLALSTPNLGTLTRYNVGVLPFMVLLVMQHPLVTKIVSKIF